MAGTSPAMTKEESDRNGNNGDHKFRCGPGRTAVGATDDHPDVGVRAAGAVFSRVSRLRALSDRLRTLAGAPTGKLRHAVQRPGVRARGAQHSVFPAGRHQPENDGGAVSVGLLYPGTLVDQMAVGAFHPAMGGAFDSDHPVGALHAQSRMGRDQSADLQVHRRGRSELAQRSYIGAVDGDCGSHLEIAAVLDADPDDRTACDLARSVRSGRCGRRELVAEIPLHHLAFSANALSHLHPALDDLDTRRFQQRLSVDRWRASRPQPCARDARHPLSQARSARSLDGCDRLRAAAGAAAGLLHDETAVPMKLPSLREVGIEAKLLLIGIPVFIWTMLPIYHMFLFAISPKEDAFAGKLWPDHPTLYNFSIVFNERHYFLSHFWLQLWNSTVIAVAVGALTLLIATAAAFAISRLRVPGGRWVMNLALFTYFIPAAFLAVPMYRTMGTYGLLNNHWALILAMVTISSPYAIWVLKQASDKLPLELDEAAVMDGATTLQLFRLVYLPLMMPSMVAVGIYAILLAWNEYLYAFLLLSRDTEITLPVALGNFLAADDSPWELLMTTGFIYALPPAAIYYVFKRYMVGGLTAGAVKS